MSDTPGPHGPDAAVGTGCDGAERFREQAELRRLRRELELAGRTTLALTDRLRCAEAELAEGTGPVVAAMATELARSQSRAGAAEAELAALRSNPLFRVAAPMVALARVARRGPELLSRLARRAD